MMETITHYIVPIGGIFGFGLFAVHIAESVGFIAKRLGIAGSGEFLGDIADAESEAGDTSSGVHEDSETSDSDGPRPEPDEDGSLIDSMDSGFSIIGQNLSYITERQEHTEDRVIQLCKFTSKMFKHILDKMEGLERGFEDIQGPLQEILQRMESDGGSVEQPPQDEDRTWFGEPEIEMEAYQYD